MNSRKKYMRLVPVLAGVVFVALTTVVVLSIKDFLDKPVQTKKMVQQISIINVPPPPKIEKPPEPEVKEEVKIEEPENIPEDMPDVAADDLPPMGDALGLDSDGGAGGDGFGLLGRKGGRDFIGGNSGDQFAWYSGLLQQDILDFLSLKDSVRTGKYSIVVKLWVDKQGKIERVVLANTTGDKNVDNALRVAFTELAQFQEPPPENMPQPIKLRISSRI